MIAKILSSIFVFAVIKILPAQSFYNWPCAPFDQQHFINGTFCENRPSGSINIHHFHDGVDINLPQGNNVYSVINGSIRINGRTYAPKTSVSACSVCKVINICHGYISNLVGLSWWPSLAVWYRINPGFTLSNERVKPELIRMF